MKLSDAIRKGAMQRPQAYGVMFGLGVMCGQQGSSCALGAAYEGIFGLPKFGENYSDRALSTELEAAMPLLLTTGRRCPVVACGADDAHGTLGQRIAHLNDDHEWTREAIADWVEVVEEAAA